MKHILEIYTDRLKDGHQEKIEERLDPGFLDICEAELTFKEPIEVKGQAYLAQDELVIHCQIATACQIPCCICNEPVSIPLLMQDVYLVQPLQDIKGAVFDMKDALRETILLEIPAFIECLGGHCPQREQIGRYLRKEDHAQHPFSQLQIKNARIVEEP